MLSKLAGKAGEAVGGLGESAAAGMRGAEIPGAGIVGGLGKIGEMATSGAIEGGAFGAANQWSEDLLGDKQTTAENLLAATGHGALWGAGIGGALGGLKATVPPSVTGVRSAFDNFAEKAFGKFVKTDAEKVAEGLEGAAPSLDKLAEEPIPGAGPGGVEFVPGYGMEKFADGMEKLSGGKISKDKIYDMVKAVYNAPKTAAERFELSSNMYDALTGMKSAVDNGFKEVYNKISDEAVEKGLKDANPEIVQQVPNKVVNHLDEVIAEAQSKPADYNLGAVKKLEAIKSQYINDVAEETDPAKIFKATNTVNSRASEIARKDYQGQYRTQNLFRNDLGGRIKGELEKTDVWGDVAGASAQLRHAYAEVKQAEEAANVLMKGKGPKRKFDRTSLRTYTNMINDSKGIDGGEQIDRLADAYKKVPDALENMYKVSGKDSNKEAFKDILDKHHDLLQGAQQKASANKAMGHGVISDEFTSILTKASKLGYAFAGPAYAPVDALVGFMAKAANQPEEAVAKLVNLHKASMMTVKAIENISKRAFEPVVKAAEMSKEGIKMAAESTKKVKDQIDEVNDRADMGKAVDKLEKSTRDIQKVAPDISQNLQIGLIKGALFLKSKIPAWSDNTTQGVFDSKKPVSKTQNMQWARYHDAVEDPVVVMKDAVNGKINPQGIETLNAVYPNLYAQMKQALMTQIVNKKSKNGDLSIPYQKRIALSNFMGMDLDSSQNPINVTQNQSIIAHNAMQKQAQEAQAMKPTQKGLEKIDVADRSLTAAQGSNQRAGG
jgi:hypothetical protein